MNKKEEEIQRKLLELETSVLKEQTDLTTTSGHGTSNMSTTGAGTAGGGAHAHVMGGSDGEPTPKSDGFFLGGLACTFLGLVMVFQHVRVSSGLLAMLGMGSGGFALLFLPLMIGIGMMFYNPKSKWGWVMTVLSCVFLILSFLATLVVSWPSLSMLQMVMMFLPFALGGAFIVKGLGGAKGVQQAVRSQMINKQS